MTTGTVNAAPSEETPGSSEPKRASSAPVRRKAPVRSLPVVTVPGSFWHRVRKQIHAVCVVIFVALPFFDVMRFDIPRQRFYFAGQELWINEFGIIFLSLMFLLFLITAASMLYGRIYCGYLCPQMIFGEAASVLETRVRKLVNKRFIKLSAMRRQWLSRAVFYVLLGIGSVFVSFVFIAYFVEPRDLLGRLLSFDIVTAGGIAGAVTTLITFADFAFVRQRFCTTVCPYGYLQGMLGDDHTLIVHYRDPEHECIECKKCVRICHMGIDIRNSPYQIECIHCGECIDACEEIMHKVGKETLIHYTWGEHGELLGQTRGPWYRRIGMTDAKRVVVVLVLVAYAAALGIALSMRHDVLVRVAPVRTTMFRVGDDGQIYNQFRMTLANRGRKDAQLTLSLTDLPGARITLDPNPVTIGAGDSIETQFEIAAPNGALPAGVNHFAVVGRVTPDDTVETFDMTFITPVEKAK